MTLAAALNINHGKPGRPTEFDYYRLAQFVAHTVRSEPKWYPMPDAVIAELAERSGIHATSYAVARCRKALGILPSWRRRHGKTLPLAGPIITGETACMD